MSWKFRNVLLGKLIEIRDLLDFSLRIQRFNQFLTKIFNIQDRDPFSKAVQFFCWTKFIGTIETGLKIN